MGSSRILSCHDIQLALNVSGSENYVGFMFVLYFAIQIFVREMFQSTFAQRKIKKLKTKNLLRTWYFAVIYPTIDL